MRESIAQISNLRRLVNAARTLMHRSPGSPGIGMVWGPVGFGKSTATRHICLIQDAVWKEALPDWTPNWMLGDLAVELGAGRRHNSQLNFENVVGALRQTRRAVFIDEADRLCRKLHLVETLRAVHDATDAPLILIGMKELPNTVSRIPQLESRIAHWVEFKSCDLADTRTMAAELCEVTLDDDVIAQVHQASGGSARSIRVALERIERLADRAGLKRVRWRDIPSDYDLTYARRERKPGKPAISNVTPISGAANAS
jgi:DNA transposition AAA+ family ATPase